MTQAEIQLLESYLDGRLEDREIEGLQSLLQNSAEARAMLRSLATVDFGLQEFADSRLWLDVTNVSMAEPLTTRPYAASTIRSIPFYGKALLTIAALAIVALTTSLWVQRGTYRRNLAAASAPPDRSIATIIGLGGIVLWTGDGGRVSSDLNLGSELSGGTIEGASPTSWVELLFRDGSTVTVSGDSRLTFSDFGQKVLHLKSGSVASKVSPQAADSPMLVHTRTATLEVLGTAFNVESNIDSTSLNVTKGKVRLKRLSDGRSIDVPANNRVVATGSAELTAKVIPETVSFWKSQLQQGPAYVVGKWLPQTDEVDARLRAVPYLHRTPEQQSMTVFAASLQVLGHAGSPVTLQTNSKIRVRGRLKQAQFVVFGVTVRQAEGGTGGNFMNFNPTLIPDEAGRFEIIVNASDLRLDPAIIRSQKELTATPIGAIVDAFFCSTLTDTAELEIVEVEIFQANEK